MISAVPFLKYPFSLHLEQDCIYIHLHMEIYLYMHTYIYIYVYIYIYIYIFVLIHVHIFVYTFMYMFMQRHTLSFLPIHTGRALPLSLSIVMLTNCTELGRCRKYRSKHMYMHCSRAQNARRRMSSMQQIS